MLKKTWLLVLVLGLGFVLPVAAQDTLTETFRSSRFEFRYPAGWTVNDGDQVVLLTPDGLTALLFAVSENNPGVVSVDWGTADAGAVAENIAALFADSDPSAQFDPTIETELENYPVAAIFGRSPTQDYLIVVLDARPEGYVVLLPFGTPGTLDPYLAVFLEIAGTVTYFGESDAPTQIAAGATATATPQGSSSGNRLPPTWTPAPSATPRPLPTTRAQADGVDLVYGGYITGEQENSEGESFTFRGAANDTVQIDLVAFNFDDPYLLVYDPNGGLLIENDDGGDNLNAAVIITLPLDGVYTIVADSYSDSQPLVTFTLRLTLRPELGGMQSIAFGQTASAELVSAQHQTWTFSGTRGQVARIEAVGDFFLHVALYAPDGELIGQNDNFDLIDAVIPGVTLPADGTYRIVVRGRNEFYFGAYELTLRRG